MTDAAPRFRPALCSASLLVALTLPGCATQVSTHYPSLLPRAIEQRSDAEPDAAVVIADPEPATDAALADIRKTLDEAKTGFNTAADTAERLATAAHGAAVGSDRWIAAQTALAELDGYRATTSAAVTDLDSLALARAADGKPDYPALTSMRAEAQAALDAQSTRISAIADSLPGA